MTFRTSAYKWRVPTEPGSVLGGSRHLDGLPLSLQLSQPVSAGTTRMDRSVLGRNRGNAGDPVDVDQRRR
jgi:hypothetical protein